MIILDDNIWQKICLFIRKRKCLLWKKLINLGYTLTKHKSVYFKKLLAVYVLYIITF